MCFPSCNWHDSRHLERTTTLINFLLPSPYLNKNTSAPIPPMSCPFQNISPPPPLPWHATSADDVPLRQLPLVPGSTKAGFTLTPCHPVLASPGLGFPVILCNKLLPYLVRNIQQLLNIEGSENQQDLSTENFSNLQVLSGDCLITNSFQNFPTFWWNSATKTPQNQRVSKNTPNCLSSCVKLCNDLRPGPWGASHLAKEQLWWLKPLVYHYNEWMRIYLLQNWQISIAALLCFEITYKGNTKMDSFIFARYFFQHGSAQ